MSHSMLPMESIEQIPVSVPLGDNSLFSYEWDVFEQSLEWAHQDSSFAHPSSLRYQDSISHQDSRDWLSESVLSTSPSSPADSHFSPTSHSPSSPDPTSLQSQHPNSTSNPKLPLPKQLLSKKSKPRRRQQSPESRARRRSQNREAQRAFRCRKQQHTEEMEIELLTVVGKYNGLREKYENLSVLYMDLLKQKGIPGDDAVLGWRPEDLTVALGGHEEMLGQEFDVSELLFGSGMEGPPGEGMEV